MTTARSVDYLAVTGQLLKYHPPQTASQKLFVTDFEPAQDLHIAVLVPARGKEQKWALIKNPRQTIHDTILLKI